MVQDASNKDPRREGKEGKATWMGGGTVIHVASQGHAEEPTMVLGAGGKEAKKGKKLAKFRCQKRGAVA